MSKIIFKLTFDSTYIQRTYTNGNRDLSKLLLNNVWRSKSLFLVAMAFVFANEFKPQRSQDEMRALPIALSTDPRWVTWTADAHPPLSLVGRAPDAVLV